MNPNTDKLIEKVKKLLALAGNNPSEEEATAAALKAQELIADYNLKIEDEDEKIEMVHASFHTGKENVWKRSLSNVVASNFRCRAYWTSKWIDVTFFGYKHDAQTATVVFEYLFNYCKIRGRKLADAEYNRKGTSVGFFSSYCTGFVAGVKKALDAQCHALMIITPQEIHDEFDAWGKKRGLQTKDIPNPYSRGYNKDAYGIGVKEGQDAMSRKKITA